MQICDYGCGQEAKYQFKNKRWCCNNYMNSCPAKREKITGSKNPAKRQGVREKISLSKKGKFFRRNIKSELIIGDYLCSYGCGQSGKYRLRNGKVCCNKSQNVCPVNRKKNSDSLNIPQAKEKRVKSLKQSLSKPSIREKISKLTREGMSRPEVKERHKNGVNKLEVKTKKTERMLNGGAVYANQFVRKTSWPQIKTYRNTCLVAPYPILNYPVYIRKRRWLSIDIAIPQLAIAIEYDGSRWHQDKERDDKKTKDLQEEGWKVIRYRDHVPTKEQVLNDINKTLEF